jgi:predicted secreted acid phosphatase
MKLSLIIIGLSASFNVLAFDDELAAMQYRTRQDAEAQQMQQQQHQEEMQLQAIEMQQQANFQAQQQQQYQIAQQQMQQQRNLYGQQQLNPNIILQGNNPDIGGDAMRAYYQGRQMQGR